MDQPMTDGAVGWTRSTIFSRLAGPVVLCNAILLGGFALSGINLDDLVKTPDFFNAKQDVCLRLRGNHCGASEPIRLCSEWLNLSDPSGMTHYLQPDTKLKKGPDGQYYVDRGVQADYRLLLLMLFVTAIIIGGVWAKWFLVNRYRLRLESTDGCRASPGH